jgi:hypothetical protein
MARRCGTSGKRMFRSPGAARRSGETRYGGTVNVYRCRHCGTHHVTRWGVPKPDADPLLELLAEALLGEIARAA